MHRHSIVLVAGLPDATDSAGKMLQELKADAVASAESLRQPEGGHKSDAVSISSAMSSQRGKGGRGRGNIIINIIISSNASSPDAFRDVSG
jgi:hypothetical protein